MAKKSQVIEPATEQQVESLSPEQSQVSKKPEEIPVPGIPGTQQSTQLTEQPKKTQLATQKYAVPEIEGVDMSSLAAIDDAQLENLGLGDLQVARIGIVQLLTPEVVDEVPGWKPGMLFDTTSREILTLTGKAPWLLAKGIEEARVNTVNYLPFVPIFKLPSEFCLWPTKEERKEGMRRFKWKSVDPSEPRVRDGLWPPKGRYQGEGAPPVTEHTNVLGICLDQNGNPKTAIMIATFSRTSFKTGGKLVNSCYQHKMSNLPFWGRVYYFFTNIKEFDEGKAYVLDFAKGEKMIDYCKNNYKDEDGKKNEELGFELGKRVFKQCYDVALSLSDASPSADGNSTKGKQRQLAILNTAAFDEDEAHDGSTDGETTPGGDEPNF